MPTVSQNPFPKQLIYIICFALGLLVMFYFKGCGPGIEIGVKSDIKQKIDTVTTIDTAYIIKYKIVYKTKLKYDSIIIHDTTKLELCRYERVYCDTVKDSLAIIITTDTVIGELKSHKINYTLALPAINKNTTITDSVFITKEVIPRWHRLHNAKVAINSFFAGALVTLGTVIYFLKP